MQTNGTFTYFSYFSTRFPTPRQRGVGTISFLDRVTTAGRAPGPTKLNWPGRGGRCEAFRIIAS